MNNEAFYQPESMTDVVLFSTLIALFVIWTIYATVRER